MLNSTGANAGADTESGGRAALEPGGSSLELQSEVSCTKHSLYTFLVVVLISVLVCYIVQVGSEYGVFWLGDSLSAAACMCRLDSSVSLGKSSWSLRLVYIVSI
jgi:hypothetical protein